MPSWLAIKIKLYLIFFFFFLIFLFLFSFFFFPAFFRVALAAYGGSQARDLMGATAAGLHHSHSKARSELGLQPILQLTATPGP